MQALAQLNQNLQETIELQPDAFDNLLQLEWAYQVPASRANKMLRILGQPSNISRQRGGYVEWRYVDPLLRGVQNEIYPVTMTPQVYTRIVIKDQEIPHLVPEPHKDFFYACIQINISQDKIADVLAISESLSYDSLKHELCARCHLMLPNLVSLYMAKMVAKGEKSLAHAQQEYCILIKTMQKIMKNKGVGIDLAQPGKWDVTLTNYVFDLNLSLEQFP